MTSSSNHGPAILHILSYKQPHTHETLELQYIFRIINKKWPTQVRLYWNQGITFAYICTVVDYQLCIKHFYCSKLNKLWVWQWRELKNKQTTFGVNRTMMMHFDLPNCYHWCDSFVFLSEHFVQFSIEFRKCFVQNMAIENLYGNPPLFSLSFTFVFKRYLKPHISTQQCYMRHAQGEWIQSGQRQVTGCRSFILLKYI